MVKPSNPQRILARMVTRQGGGRARRPRKGVTAKEVAEAVSIVRLKYGDEALRNPELAGTGCWMAIMDAMETLWKPPPRDHGKPRHPHMDSDWDLVALYANLVGIDREQACVELGLGASWPSPIPPKPKPKPEHGPSVDDEPNPPPRLD
jgi:hypothetical protein